MNGEKLTHCAVWPILYTTKRKTDRVMSRVKNRLSQAAGAVMARARERREAGCEAEVVVSDGRRRVGTAAWEHKMAGGGGGLNGGRGAPGQTNQVKNTLTLNPRGNPCVPNSFDCDNVH